MQRGVKPRRIHGAVERIAARAVELANFQRHAPFRQRRQFARSAQCKRKRLAGDRRADIDAIDTQLAQYHRSRQAVAAA
jgi:hypothetical protein